MQQIAPVFAEQLVGQSFGNYRTEQLLGHGQLSAVYLARQHNTLRRVMLTIFMLPSWCEGASWGFFMDRFSQVASVLVTLQHPHILPTYDFGEVYNHPYLVTAFKEGISLASILQTQKRYTPAQVLYVLKQIVDVLDYVHEKGLVHGSLRTSGILLDSQRSVLMSGFGLAHILEARDLISISRSLPHLYSLADTLLYSPEYVAPEVVEGAPADARSDIYSLGIVLYELLCGKLPFTGEDGAAVALQHLKRSVPPLHEVYPEAPAALDFVIQRALDRDPARRFQSAARLAQAFQGVMSVLAGAEAAAPEQAGERLFDVSQRPTLHWFEAESSPYIQWNPPVSPTEAIPVIDITGTSARAATPPTFTPRTPPSVPAVEQQQAPVSSIESVPTAQQRPVPASPLLSVGAPVSFRPSAKQNQQNAQSVADLSKKVTAPVPRKQRRSKRVSRRAVLIASGGVVAASGLAAAGGFAYLRFIRPKNQPAMNQHGKSMPKVMPTQQKKGSTGSMQQAMN
jgi:serine/threonine protein kinase